LRPLHNSFFETFAELNAYKAQKISESEAYLDIRELLDILQQRSQRAIMQRSPIVSFNGEMQGNEKIQGGQVLRIHKRSGFFR